MAENRDLPAQQITAFVRRLTISQKITMGAVTVGVVVALGALVSVLNKPSYNTLFSNVNAQDAAKIVEKLKEKNVSYQLDDAGRTILVPKEQVYELRLSLAGEGLPQSSVIGYEIFDRTNLGISDFVQKVNYRRALEGELARTILELEEVEAARVHIVVPQRTLFKEDEKPATASIVLKLKTGRPLRPDAVQGITHLVSSSVEGLDPSNVTIVDSRGLMLSKSVKQDPLLATTSSQYDMQQKVESYLAQKAQSMLDGVLGSGNAIVRVSADLDFTQVDRTLEQYDGNNPVVRSEQTTEEKTPAKDVPTPATRKNSVTNYEVNKTMERIVGAVGTIKRLSAAVMINGIPKTVEKNGEKTTEYTPRPQEELDRLSDIIKKSIGFSVQRNDEVSMMNMSFGTAMPQEELVTQDSPFTRWYDLAGKLGLVGAVIAGILIVRSMLNKLRVQVNVGEGATLGNPAVGTIAPNRQRVHLASPEDEISDEVLLRGERRKTIVTYVETKPQEASRLLKVWLAEEEA